MNIPSDKSLPNLYIVLSSGCINIMQSPIKQSLIQIGIKKLINSTVDIQ